MTYRVSTKEDFTFQLPIQYKFGSSDSALNFKIDLIIGINAGSYCR